MKQTIDLVFFCVPYYYLYFFVMFNLFGSIVISIEFQFYIYCAVEQIYVCFGMRRSLDSEVLFGQCNMRYSLDTSLVI